MIVLFGIAGAGKGTQAEILAKRLGVPIVTTGEILRQNRDNPEVRAAIESGNLVNDDITLGLLEAEFKKIGADKNEFILDGSPRSTYQAHWLDKKIKADELKLTAIIYIHLSQAEAFKRLKGRGRHDDTEKAINERFDFYDQSVIPALRYLKDEGHAVIEIDGDQSVEDVAKQIEKALNAS